MSHHSSDDATSKALHAAMFNLLGEYPDGRLNAEDEGAISCAVGHEKGTVKLLFPKRVSWVGFTPEQAIDLAQDLIKHARQCGFAGVYTLQIALGEKR